MLADVNVQAHATFLQHAMEALGLWETFTELHLQLVTCSHLDIPNDIDDRQLWTICQNDGWVLFTENRSRLGANSLEATLADAWRPGQLPVLTLANKKRFELIHEYAWLVASDVAELLFGIAHAEYCDRPRIYVPLNLHRADMEIETTRS